MFGCFTKPPAPQGNPEQMKSGAARCLCIQHALFSRGAMLARGRGGGNGGVGVTRCGEGTVRSVQFLASLEQQNQTKPSQSRRVGPVRVQHVHTVQLSVWKVLCGVPIAAFWGRHCSSVKESGSRRPGRSRLGLGMVPRRVAISASSGGHTCTSFACEQRHDPPADGAPPLSSSGL